MGQNVPLVQSVSYQGIAGTPINSFAYSPVGIILRVTPYITPDGLDIGMTTGSVNVGNVGSTFTLNRVGRRNPTVKLVMHHDATSGSTDPAWNLLVYRTLGFLAVRLGLDKATAWTTGQGGGGANGSLEMYPSECGEYEGVKVAPDTSWDFSVDLNVYLDPNKRSVVA